MREIGVKSDQEFSNTSNEKKPTSFNGTGRVHHGLGFDQNAVTAKVQTYSSPYRNDHRSFDDEGEEIVLSGGDYLGLEATLGDKRTATRPAYSSHTHNDNLSHSRSDGNAMRNSTVSLTGDDWRHAVKRHSSEQVALREELDEFESLEQQLHDISRGGASASHSTSGSSGSSSQHQSGLHHHRRQESRDVNPDFEGDEDSDPLGRSTTVYTRGDQFANANVDQQPSASSRPSTASRPQFKPSGGYHDEEEDEEEEEKEEEEEEEEEEERSYRFNDDTKRQSHRDEDDVLADTRTTSASSRPVHVYRDEYDDDEEEGEEDNEASMGHESDYQFDPRTSSARDSSRHNAVSMSHSRNTANSVSRPAGSSSRHSSDFDQYDAEQVVRHSRSSGAALNDSTAWGATTQPAQQSSVRHSNSHLGGGSTHDTFRSSSAYPDADHSVNSSINDISAYSHHNIINTGSNSSTNISGSGGVKLAGSVLRKLNSTQNRAGSSTPPTNFNSNSSANFDDQQSESSNRGRGFNDTTTSNSNSVGNSQSVRSSSRPVSSLRTETAPPQSHGGKNGQSHPSNSNSNTNNNINNNNNAIPPALAEKARELEAELERYRTENATLVRLRKQSEAALKEVVQQKEETQKWAAEERQRVTLWCDQQKAIVAKERKAAAKQAHDARIHANVVPIRKEKAEIEALTATVEKMRVDHDTAQKKFKVSEHRLNGLIKDHTTRIDLQDRMLQDVEEQKILLLEFITQNDLRLPRPLRARIEHRNVGPTDANVPATGQSKGGNKSQKAAGVTSRYAGERGYVEEVDVQMVQSRSRTIPANPPPPLSAEYGGYGEVEEEGDSQYGDRSQGALRSNLDDDHGASRRSQSNGRPSSASSSAPNLGSSSKGASLAAQSRAQAALRPPTSATMNSAEFGKQTSKSVVGSSKRDMGSSRGSGVLTATNTSASFAGSNRSSATRYSSADSDQEADSHEQQVNRYGAGKGVAASPHTHTAQTPPLSISTSRMPNNVAAAQDTPNGSGSVDSGRMEEILPDGTRLITYRNGTRKEVHPNGDSVVLFVNGDSKHVLADSGVVVYYYDQAQTTHTTYPDGKEVYEFPNKQIEKHFPDGTKEIEFPDQTRKVIYADDVQESHFPDGVILREYPDGHKEVVTDQGPYRGGGDHY
eukprot:gene23081-29274_t